MTRTIYHKGISSPSCLGGVRAGSRIIVQRTDGRRTFTDEATFDGMVRDAGGNSLMKYFINIGGRRVAKEVDVVNYDGELAVYMMLPHPQ